MPAQWIGVAAIAAALTWTAFDMWLSDRTHRRRVSLDQHIDQAIALVDDHAADDHTDELARRRSAR